VANPQLCGPDYRAESLAESLSRARASELTLRGIEGLRDAGKRLLMEVEKFPSDVLVPVNMLAQSLLTSAQLLSDRTFVGPIVGTGPARRALVVAAVTVTGSLCNEEAAELRAAGARWVGLLVYQRVRPDLDGFDNGGLFDRVISFGSF
jgi:hypothetical protein